MFLLNFLILMLCMLYNYGYTNTYDKLLTYFVTKNVINICARNMNIAGMKAN